MQKVFPLLLLCWLWCGASFAQSILILGDSLSAGYGLSQQQSWPVLLQHKLTTSKTKWQIINASISGETTGGALARLPALLKNHQMQYLLIELGGNDGLRGFPISTIEQNLQQIILQTIKAGVMPILMQINIPPNYGPRYTEQFQQIYPKLAAAHQIPIWPFFMQKIAIQPELMQNDGIHPNLPAQPIIAELIEKLLLEL